MEQGWQQWGKNPEVEGSLIQRAKGSLPQMESTKQLVRLMQPIYKAGMRVLDVGCNVGHYLRGLRTLDPTLDYTGVDAYASYIDQAKQVYAADKHAKFMVKDIHQPLFPEQPFDITYNCNVLLHLPDFRGPVKNLIASTKGTLFIRLLLGERTTIVKRSVDERFNDAGEPVEFIYQNTWKRETFASYVKEQGRKVEFIEDEFDASVLQGEHGTLKAGIGTRIVSGMQADGNILFNWTWAKITAG